MVYTHVENQVERQLLEEGISKLSKREQQIIGMRFGLDGEEERTQKEVADLLGISQSYISRLEKKIISRLKKEIGKLV
jgi:RNA polymerase sporulation-specific sigma factor